MNTPYGPATADVRHFLVQLAGLGVVARGEVVGRFEAVVHSPEFAAAETLLGETIERAGRTDARDALAGPLLQLVRSPDDTRAAGAVHDDRDVMAQLDPIAEPALAAVLSLVVGDLLPPTIANTLYAPFADVIPRRSRAD